MHYEPRQGWWKSSTSTIFPEKDVKQEQETWWLLLLPLLTKRNHRPVQDKGGFQSNPQRRTGKAHMEKVPFSLMGNKLSADTNLNRYLRWPVHKICVHQGPPSPGKMLQGTPMGLCQRCGVPLLLWVGKPGPSHCHSRCWGFSGFLAGSEALPQCFLIHMQRRQHQFGSWFLTEKKLFN